MPIETKKFLDQTGTGYLWSKIKAALDTKGAVDSVTAANNSITIAGTAADPTIAVRLSNKAGNALSIETTSGSEGLYVSVPSADAYTITKDATSADYAAVYHLTKNGTNEGVAINIPKDMVVSSGTVETKSTSGDWGAAGTYLVLTLANATNDEVYIPVGSLIEYVTSGSANTDAVVISVDSTTHQVTASLTDGSIAATKLAADVQTALNNAGTALQPSDIATGSTNGTISVGGSDVAVYGLGTAAYTAATAYDAAGSADAVYAAIQSLTNAEIDAAIAANNS